MQSEQGPSAAPEKTWATGILRLRALEATTSEVEAHATSGSDPRSFAVAAVAVADYPESSAHRSGLEKRSRRSGCCKVGVAPDSEDSCDAIHIALGHPGQRLLRLTTEAEESLALEVHSTQLTAY